MQTNAGPVTPDRSTAIMVLGIIQIVLGGLTALIAILGVAWMAMMASRMEGEYRPPMAMMVLPILFYLIPAANLATTGIGSVRFRPWARLTTIISSAIWLGLGVLMVIGVVLSMFVTRSSIGSAEIIVMLVVMAPLMCGFPTILIVLYTRPGVRETFARRFAEKRAATGI